MSSEPSKISGYTSEVIGAVKENFGWVLGDKELEAAGRATRTKGELEVDAAVTQEKLAPSEPSVVAGYAHQATGALKENLGWALGNEQLEIEGKATRELGAQELEAAQAIQHNEPSEPSKLSELTQEAKIKAQQATGTVKEYAATAQEKVQPYTEQAKEAVKPIADKASALTTQAKETVKEYAATAQEKVQPYTEQAKEAVKPIADKASALTTQAQGAVKENVGWAVGNKEMEASGKAIREKGKFDAYAAHAEQRATGKKVQGNIVFLDEAKTFPAQQPITTPQQQSNF